MTETLMTDAERIAVQRAVVAEHIQGESTGDYEIVKATFVESDRAYFDCVAGGVHLDGKAGIADFYDAIATALPDLRLTVTHEPGSTVPGLRGLPADLLIL